MPSGASFVLSLVLLLSACGGDQEGATTEAARTEPAETEPAETEPATTTEEHEPGAKGMTAGKKIFVSQGCGACHTFRAAGTTGTTGPNLDKALRGHHGAPPHVREAIVDPNADVSPGFEPNVMPQDYDEKLSDEQIDALVAFLTKKHKKKHR